MTTLLLIRHGETDASDKLLAGWMPGWHLNPRGRQQVEKLAQRLADHPLAAIYTSPLERTMETAEAIARRHGIEPQPVKGIGEVQIGEWQGKTFVEIAEVREWVAYNALRSGVRPPGGELMIECQTRMVQEAERIARKHPNDTVALVSHGDPLRVLIAYFLGISLDLLSRFEISLASLSVVRMADGGLHVLCVQYGRNSGMKLVIFGLSINSSWGNGHATIWRGLCRALARRGHRVVFFERDPPRRSAVVRSPDESARAIRNNRHLLLHSRTLWHPAELHQPKDVREFADFCASVTRRYA